MHVACILLPQFGIAVERARRPELAGEPVALYDEETQTVRVASDEAGRFGIRPGQKVSGARALCPALFALHYDRGIYEESAAAVWDALAVESSIVEPEAPEAAFAELSGPDAASRFQRLVDQIAESLGPGNPLLAGLARTKLLARCAASSGLPPLHDGNKCAYCADCAGRAARVTVVPAGRETATLAPVRIDTLPHLDSEMAQKLLRLGVKTLGDLRSLPAAELERRFRRAGLFLHRLARGDDGDPVKPCWPPPSIEESYRFDAAADTAGFLETAVDRRTVDHALGCCAHEIARRLQARRVYCRTLTLIVTYADGTQEAQSERLNAAHNRANSLHAAALRLFDRLCNNGAAPACSAAASGQSQPPQAVTLRASDVAPGSGIQLALMDERGVDRERRLQLEAKLADLRVRYGVGAVTEGALRKPSKASLYTFSLTHRRAEPVDVETDEHGDPVRVWRAGRRGAIRGADVLAVRDVWKETKWFWDGVSRWTVYRLELEPAGLYDLYHVAHDDWRLGAVAD